MNEIPSELERFMTNTWTGHAPGLWLTVRIDLGNDADLVQQRFLSAISAWLQIADPIHREYGLDRNREVFPAPQDIAPRLPKWLIDDFDAYTEQQVLESDWRYYYESWVDAMEERCCTWWGYERIDDTLIVQLQVDGWPCPTEELAFLARAAGARSVSVDD